MSALSIQKKGQIGYLSSRLVVMVFAYANSNRDPLYYTLGEEDRRKAEEPLMATLSCWKKGTRAYAAELDNLPVIRLAVSGQSLAAITPAGVIVTISQYVPQERSGCPPGEPIIDEELLALSDFKALSGYDLRRTLAQPKGGTPKGDDPKGDSPKGDGPKGDGPKGDGPKGDGPKGDDPKGRKPKWIWT